MTRLISPFCALSILLFTVTGILSAEIPERDPDLFSYLFSHKEIPQNWIFEPANEELTPAMMADIAQRLSSNGGTYQDATKSAKGWVLNFVNGTAKARIVRSEDRKLIGVFFGKLE